MKKIKVDAMGDQCPIPVIKTKKALKEITETTLVEVHVDNEIAVQNLSKKEYKFADKGNSNEKERISLKEMHCFLFRLRFCTYL